MEFHDFPMGYKDANCEPAVHVPENDRSKVLAGPTVTTCIGHLGDNVCNICTRFVLVLILVNLL